MIGTHPIFSDVSMPKSTYICPLSPEVISLLGTTSDADVGRIAGRPSCSIKYHRTQLGIEAFGSQPWLESYNELLGKMPDSAVAEITGAHPSTVGKHRKRLNIPIFGDEVVHRPKYVWSEDDDDLLGTMRDKDVAARLGITEIQARYRRTELGIPSVIFGRTAKPSWGPKASMRKAG